MLLDAFADEKLMETLEKIDDTIKRHNVRFVRLQFSDIVGIVKQVTIPIELWDRAVENGVWFDGSSIEGFARVAGYIHADPLGDGAVHRPRCL